MNRLGFGLRLIILSSALLSAVAALAQLPATVPNAPIPTPILNAKKIFLANGGLDGTYSPWYNSDPNRAYNQLYAGLKSTSRLELVSDPADADLILELRIDGDFSFFRLAISDRKTHSPLWTLIRSCPNCGAIRKNDLDRNLDKGLSAILKDFDNLTGKPSDPAR